MRTSLVAVLVLVVLVACGAVAGGAGAAGARRLQPLLRATVTGEITSLGPGRIAIGRLACAVPAAEVASVGRFVVGDPVRIACRSGRLLSVRYSPETETGATDTPVPAGTRPNVAPPAPVSSTIGASAFTATFGSVTLGAAGGSATPSTPSLTTESGPIAVLDSTSINVGGITCLLGSSDFDTAFVYKALLRFNVAEGDLATVTCVNGVLGEISSST